MTELRRPPDSIAELRRQVQRDREILAACQSDDLTMLEIAAGCGIVLSITAAAVAAFVGLLL